MTDPMTFDERHGHYEKALKAFLTPAFLDTLTHAARTYGDMGDWPAVKDFVAYCYALAEAPCPDLAPYD